MKVWHGMRCGSNVAQLHKKPSPFEKNVRRTEGFWKLVFILKTKSKKSKTINRQWHAKRTIAQREIGDACAILTW